jgi:hypothetical protein
MHLKVGTHSYIVYPLLLPSLSSLLAFTPIYSDITAMGTRQVPRFTGVVTSVALLTPIYSDLDVTYARRSLQGHIPFGGGSTKCH